MLEKVYHIKATKDYAIKILELLRKDGAIEDVDVQNFSLSSAQMKALDDELQTLASEPDYLLDWEEVKKQFEQPE